MVVDSLTLEQYHHICYFHLSWRRTITISTDITVNLGAVLVCSSGDQLDGSAEIAFLPDVEVSVGRWYGAKGVAMENGWMRYFILSFLDEIYPNHV